MWIVRSLMTAFRDGKEIGTLNTELTLHVAYLWPKEVQLMNNVKKAAALLLALALILCISHSGIGCRNY